MDLISINCTNTNKKENFPIGISLLELAKKKEKELGFKALFAKVNNEAKALTEKLYKVCTVEFAGLGEKEGRITYLNTLNCIISKAVSELFPKTKFVIKRSLANGYFCTFEGKGNIDLQKLKERVDAIISSNLPFKTETLAFEEAIEHFQKEGMEDKVSLIKTAPSHYISYVHLDGFSDMYNGFLAPSTGSIYLYALESYLDGFLLRIPSPKKPDELPQKREQAKMHQVFKEQEDLLQMLHLPFVGDLNTQVQKGDIADTILVSEAMQEKKIAEIASSIADSYTKGVRIVFISGPSSSGKTTFTKRLSTQLRTCFLHPNMISMDDYFLEREKTPRDENGELDFESLYALDLEAFNKDLQGLLKGDKVSLPTFNFYKGEREYLGKELQLKEGELLLIEGIHALNPELVPLIDAKTIFRVYVSALTTINVDRHNYVSTTDNRLVRRLVRDYQYRGYSAIDTLSRWSSVRRGEEKWVFPYQENADAMFNSAMVYELGALRSLAEPLLLNVPSIVPEYTEARRLLRLLHFFSPIDSKHIPRTSLLREFVGGSFFKD